MLSISACESKIIPNSTRNVQNPSQLEEPQENKNAEKSNENTDDTAEPQTSNEDVKGDTVSNEEDMSDTPSNKEDMSDTASNEEGGSNTASNEEDTSDTASEDTENKETDVNTELIDGMRPEFKEAMDSYEAFYNEYCDLLKNYAENPSDIELLAAYTNMLKKSVEMSEKFEAWENSDLNTAELKYYLDVNNRITKKFLELNE